MEITTYNSVNGETTCTGDSRHWHTIDIKGWAAGNIRAWINKNSKGLKGGYIIEGLHVKYSNDGVSTIRFQKEEDVMFFKLSFK